MPLDTATPKISDGNIPADRGNLILSSQEKNLLIKKYSAAEKFIRPYVGSEEFINNKQRFCLWLKDAAPNEIKKIPPIYERVQAVKKFRLSSKKIQTQRRAETPTLFAEDRFIFAKKIFVLMVSSENRNYIPIGFVDADVVVTNKALFIPNGDLLLFGILTSKVLMSWLKVVGSRFKSDFRFSASLVYNTFPFCEFSEKNCKKIERTAQLILDVRKKYSKSSLAELYDENLMPKDLREAHRQNDLAVLAAYGFDKNLSEPQIVGELMTLYNNLTNAK